MPGVEKALVARLAASTSVTSQVGTRIYGPRLPQEPKFPAITTELISNIREHAMTADFTDTHARMQVTSWAKTYSAAEAASEGVRSAVQRWQGTSTGVVVSDIFIDNEFASFDAEAGVGGTYAHVLDVTVHYQE